MRRRLSVGNWKMHKTPSEAEALVRAFLPLFPPLNAVQGIVAPPFPALASVSAALGHARLVSLAGQNLFWEDQGPFTGEVSAPMLKALGCEAVILGHSERRHWFGERDDAINKKVRAALRHHLRPILCVGESLRDREEERTNEVIGEQLRQGLNGLSPEDVSRVTIAYEPVWAIGTGRAASPAQAAHAHQFLHGRIAERWGSEAGDMVLILYGGSVTAENCAGFLAAPGVDGALVGGACLNPNSFATIVRLAEGSPTGG